MPYFLKLTSTKKSNMWYTQVTSTVSIFVDHWRSRCKGRISGPPLLHNIFLCDYRQGMDWILDLLTTCIHHLELHFTDQWHTQTSVISPLQSPLAVSWQRLLPREILQLPWSRRCPLVNTSHMHLPNSRLTAHLELQNSTADSESESESESLSVLCYDRRSVGQSVLK
jgi:hypothetical protein